MTDADNAGAHPLDNPIWNALGTRQSALSIGGPLARRFPATHARFAALADPVRPAAFEALAAIVSPGEEVGLFSCFDLHPPGFEAMRREDLAQMIGPAVGEARDPGRFVPLGEDDAPQMLALATRTQPGPFFERTHELGRFLGWKVDGRLVAMAGERLRVAGHTEISAVCVDPGWRGQGLARDLTLSVSQAIVARGERPFLHVRPGNASAVALYEQLGFTRRTTWRLNVFRRL